MKKFYRLAWLVFITGLDFAGLRTANGQYEIPLHLVNDAKISYWESLHDPSRDFQFSALWMKDDGSEGWAVGAMGGIWHYQNQKWQRNSPINGVGLWLSALWMKADGSAGWIVGEGGGIWHYFNGKWQGFEGFQDLLTGINNSRWFSAIWMKADGSEGWIVGYNGEILRYQHGKWEKDPQSGLITTNRLFALWMKDDGSLGWAMGDQGDLLRYENQKWQKDPQSCTITSNLLRALWMKADTSLGWAVGYNGEILRYQNGKWEKDPQSGLITSNRLFALWMQDDGNSGWAMGDGGEILRYENQKWQLHPQSGAITSNLLSTLWMKSDGSKGWAMGNEGEILLYQKDRWQKYPQPSGIIFKWLLAVCMKSDGSAGWAVGSDGEIVRYHNGKWQRNPQSGRVTSQWLTALWMKADDSVGWIVGNNGEILYYKNEKWQRDPQSGKITSQWLSTLWMKADGSIGWVVGANGEILCYQNGKWRKDPQSGLITSNRLSALWIQDDGNAGWAVGDRGEILRYQNQKWQRDPQSSEITFSELTALWMEIDGSTGWALSSQGEILRYQNGKWQIDSQSGVVTSNQLYALWLNDNGSEGWAVGSNNAIVHSTGEILSYQKGKWRRYPDTFNGLFDLWINADGGSGWAVGVDGEILQYKTSDVGEAILKSQNPTDLKKLQGQHLLSFDKSLCSLPIFELIDSHDTNRLKSNMYKINSANADSTQFFAQFVKVPSDLLKELEGKSCRLRVTVNYKHPRLPTSPIEAVFESNTFYVIAAPWWYLPLKIAVGVLSLNLFLIVLAIPFSSVRRIILHPVGSKVLGLIVYKYLIIDFLIRFVHPIKMGLFKDYRKQLPTAPVIGDWKNRLYVPPNIELQEPTSQPLIPDEAQWKAVLETLLAQPRGRLWLILGKSGLGKTTLFEKWTQHSLTLKKTPLLIRLGNDLSPQAEASALMSQYGDIEVKPEVALDLLKGGGFVILLDGFNEDRRPIETREFVRQVVKHNHVIMNSQFDPQWDKILPIHHIKLEPFGREQLKQLIDEKWVDQLLQAGHLSDMTQLPHTAQLLADFIKANHKLPDFRLDIYRHLQKVLADDTQRLNLERTAWELFKANKKPFAPDDRLTQETCDAAVGAGILTKFREQYQFRHELIQRFFVACYLHRQDHRSLEEWHKEIEAGLGRGYWTDVLDLWGELYAEQACKEASAVKPYYAFLKEAAKFSGQIFAERLYPQIGRLYHTGTLEKNHEFIEWSAIFLAQVAVKA